MTRSILFVLAIACSFTLSAITVNVIVWQHSYCGRASGLMSVQIFGGVPPYEIMWSNGGTDSENVGLEPGIYSVTVTDSQLDQATADGEVFLLNGYDYGVGQPPTLMHCPGDPMHVAIYTGMDEVAVQPPVESIYGPNPYSFDGLGLEFLGISTSCNNPNGIVWNLLTFNGVQPGGYTINYWDANGCPGSFDVQLGGEMEWPDLQVLDVSPSCPNYPTGSFSFACQGTGDYSIQLRSDNEPSSCNFLFDSFSMGSGTTGQTVTGLEAGDYWLIRSNDVLHIYQGSPYSYLECKDSILVTIPAQGQDCGVVAGRLYVDENANCALNGGENRIPSSIIEITPGPSYVTTSGTGEYTVTLPFGDYTFTEQSPTFTQSCPGEVTVSAGNTQTLNIGCAGGVPLDVQVALANGSARPGFQLQYGMSLQNLTAASPGAVTLTMTFDPELSYLSSTLSPTSVAGNVITWTAPQLNMNVVFQQSLINVRFQVPSDVTLIGSTLNTSIELTTANPETDLTNNTANSAQLVTGSFDPNDKVATTSTHASDSLYFINSDEWIDYTIRFQNTGTDTAFTVIVTDTLPATLDPGSVQWGASSHSGTRALTGEGVLRFTFANIQLVDSNANEAASHGFVSFRIKPRQPLIPGTQIENIANIYFDYNPPVITEPSVLTAEFTTGVQAHAATPNIWLMPNPTSGSLEVRVSDNSASGLLQVVSVDGRVVMQQRMEGPRTVLDVTQISRGLYTLCWHDTNGTITTQRFVRE